jgi:OmpA-OmpF porin, OOP family
MSVRGFSCFRHRVWTLSVAVWLSAHGVSAQEVQRFYPALGSDGFLGLDGTRTPGSWRGSANVFTDLALRPLEIATASGVKAVDQRLMLHVGLELGLGPRGAIALRLPMLLYQSELAGSVSREVFALSDPQLWLRYRLLGASLDDRDQPHDGIGLTLQLGAAFPMGQGGQPRSAGLSPPAANYPFTSDDSVRTELALVGDFQLLGAALGASVGYRHHFWNRRGSVAATTDGPDELTFGAGLRVPIPPLPALQTVLEVRGSSGFVSARDTALELALGVRLNVGDFVIALGGALGLTDGVGTPDGRLLLGVYGVLPRKDQDGDGIDDSDDACAYLAEDLDGWQDDDGCPDPDNDGDLVPDLDDKCPAAAAEEGRDEDEDGCTDPAPAGG